MNNDFRSMIDQAVRSKNLEQALVLANDWVTEDSKNSKAWSKLAHVHELLRSLADASDAVQQALNIQPTNPSYLFKAGCIEYKRGNIALASGVFARCVEVSTDINDDYYLDAARVAQAKCLISVGEIEQAASVVQGADPSSATWLDGRITAVEVSTLIQERMRYRSMAHLN